jgi:hypothetical protein
MVKISPIEKKTKSVQYATRLEPDRVTEVRIYDQMFSMFAIFGATVCGKTIPETESTAKKFGIMYCIPRKGIARPQS